MLGRFRRSFSEADYTTLILEIAVVILGILIAFQIDRWAEQRRDRDQEFAYLVRLAEDLDSEISTMDDSIATAARRIDYVRYLEQIAADPEIARNDPLKLITAVEKVSWYSFPKINGFVYDELKGTGALSVIRSDDLRRSLSDYYATIRGYERVANERDLQLRYDLETAGVLNTDELMFVEYGRWSDGAEATTSERAVEIARQLSQRRAALDALPAIAQNGVFTQKAIEDSRVIAHHALSTINTLIDEMNR